MTSVEHQFPEESRLEQLSVDTGVRFRNSDGVAKLPTRLIFFLFRDSIHIPPPSLFSLCDYIAIA
jgi:hypothetical protein